MKVRPPSRVVEPGGTGEGALVDAVVEGGVGVGGGGGFERMLHQVDGAIQKEGVGGADHDVEFALELGAEGGPIALKYGGQVVVFAPVGRDFVIDYAGALIPDFGGVAIGAGGAEDGLPDVPLFAGAAVGAEDELPAIGTFGGWPESGRAGCAFRVARCGQRGRWSSRRWGRRRCSPSGRRGSQPGRGRRPRRR